MNILLMTNSMKQPDDTYPGKTDVVFYFAKEWAKAGHRVVIIHNESKFPLFFYLAPKKLITKLQRKKFFIVPSIQSRKKLKREQDGISIYRLPMLKIIPHSGFTEAQYKKQKKLIIEYLTSISFTPDVITGHWLEPQLRLIHDLGNLYSAKTGFVVHGKLPENIKNEYKQYIKELNCFFLRSEYMKNMTLSSNQNAYMPNKVSVCYSGIPDSYISSISERTEWMNNGVFRIVYVGRLVATKRINAVIEAAENAFHNASFRLDIIGDGDELANLQDQVNQLGIEDYVVFHGRLDRDAVQRALRESDCFAMIGENEVFGLAYLEAMAAGCITIASIGSGVDGIIIPDENGYLCETGNSDDLTKLFTYISQLPIETIERIRKNASETVVAFTDSNVAKNYLSDITGQNI